jgi:tetratricopeptide (TPR) repeat protein
LSRATGFRFERKFAEAAAALEDGLKQLPGNIRLLMARGWLWFDQRDYAKARADFEAVLATDPKNDEALAARAESLRLERKFAEVAAALEEGLKQLPGSVRLLIQRGWLRVDQHNYAKARADFEAVLATDPKNDEALAGGSSALRRMRRFAEAAQELERGLKILGDNAILLYEQGLLYLDQQQDIKAEAALAAAANAAPGWLDPTFVRVDVLRWSKRGEEALSLLQTLKSESPGDLEITETLGWFYIDRYDPTNAEQQFQSLPEGPSREFGLGGVCFARGDYEGAERHFRQVVGTDPIDPTYRTSLAWALVRQGGTKELDESSSAYRLSLEIGRTLATRY